MAQELLIRNVAPQLYLSALTSAWRSGIQIYDPSIWEYREPDIDAKLLRDADIQSAATYRTHLAAGQSWDVQPSDDENCPKERLAAEVARMLIKQIKHFAGARRNLSMSFLSGARYAEIQSEVRGMRLGDGTRRQWITPTYLKDMDKKRVRLVRDDDGPSGIRPPSDGRHIDFHWEVWSLAAGEWKPLDPNGARRLIRHVYMDDEASLSHGRGLRDALGWWWYAKEHTFAETLDAVERFAQGILLAKIDGLRDGNRLHPNTTLVREWTGVLNDMRSRHILVMDKEDEIEHVQMNGQGWQLLKEIREELRTTIRALILGATLNTGGEGETGSYARAKVHESATDSLIAFDREILEETLTDDLIGFLWWANWPNIVELGLADVAMPRFVIQQDRHEDPKERADTAATLAGMGLPLARSDVYEQTGFRRPMPDEEILEAPQQPDPMGGMGGFPGMPQPGQPPQEPRPSDEEQAMGFARRLADALEPDGLSTAYDRVRKALRR